MRYLYLFIIVILFIFACGEVGETSYELPSSSSSFDDLSSGGLSSEGNSSSSLSSSSDINLSSSSEEGTPICKGAFCCNGSEFDNTINFCVEDQLYPLCGGQSYNPYEQGCFEGKLYPKCEINTVRGTCVHNSLLRCRQEGIGEQYIRDPQPGMTCEENGSITGTIKNYIGPVIEREYKIVQIGNQIWMAENVNLEDALVEAFYAELGSLYKGECYGDDPTNCDKYGKLYDWATMMLLPEGCNGTNKDCPRDRGTGLWGGVCPNDFGLPQTDDWNQLVNYAGGAEAAAGRLKSKTGWSNNGNGTDSYGFNILPGGYASYAGYEYNEIGKETHFWAETQLQSEAYFRRAIASDTEMRNNYHSKGSHLAYVRCLHYF